MSCNITSILIDLARIDLTVDHIVRYTKFSHNISGRITQRYPVARLHVHVFQINRNIKFTYIVVIADLPVKAERQLLSVFQHSAVRQISGHTILIDISRFIMCDCRLARLRIHLQICPMDHGNDHGKTQKGCKNRSPSFSGFLFHIRSSLSIPYKDG